MNLTTRGVLAKPERAFGPGVAPGAEVVVGLDPSLTAFGVTLLQVNDPTRWSAWVIASKQRGVERLSAIRTALLLLLSGVATECVAIEGYSFGSSRSQAHSLGELGGVVRLALHDVCLPLPVEVPPSTLKKFTTGKGNAAKSEMLLNVYKRWDVDISDDNAADAYALARFALGLHAPAAQSLAKYQQDALSKCAPA